MADTLNNTPTTPHTVTQPTPTNQNNNNFVTAFLNIIKKPQNPPEIQLSEQLDRQIHLRAFTIHKIPQSFYVWDFAGQEEYYNTHHFFLTEGSIYLLVLDITKSNNLQRAKFWLNSIKFYAENPTVVVFSTHSDKTLEADSKLTSLINTLKDPTIKQWMAVSCKDESQVHARKLLATVDADFVQKKPCKLGWLLFYHRISNYEASTSITYLTLNEAVKIAQAHNMDQIETKEALRFFHENGFVLYYDEQLIGDIIFTKPQQLIGAFRTIITALGLEHKLSEIELKLLREEGRLRPETELQIWQEYEPKLHQVFKVLLQKFGLAFLDPVQTTAGVQSDLMVPTLVQTSEEDFNKTFEDSPIKVICHIESIPPLGFASRLISSIMTFTNRGGVSYCEIFRQGCAFTAECDVTFLITTAPDKVTIHGKPQHALTVRDAVAVVSTILDKVYAAIKAHKTAAQVATITRCFLCQVRDHISDLQRDTISAKKFSEGNFLCYRCKSQNSVKKIPKMHLAQNEATAAKPCLQLDDKRLQRPFSDTVTKEIHWMKLCLILTTAKNGGWRELGAYFGKSLMELDGMEQDAIYQRSNPAKLLLQEWQHSESASVRKLVEALMEIHNTSAVEVLLDAIEGIKA